MPKQDRRPVWQQQQDLERQRRAWQQQQLLRYLWWRRQMENQQVAATWRPRQVRNGPPALAGLIGALGIALVLGVLGFIAHNNADANPVSPSKGKSAAAAPGKLPSVSINGALPCAPINGMDSAHLDSCVQAKTYAKQLLAQKGQTGQFQCLDQLWDHESGWSAWAVNPSSGAAGIPQALGHGHVFDIGDWRAQVDWGINYIYHQSGNFKSPCQAWSFWNSHTPHWY